MSDVHRCDNCQSIIEDCDDRVRATAIVRNFHGTADNKRTIVADYCGTCWNLALDGMRGEDRARAVAV